MSSCLAQPTQLAPGQPHCHRMCPSMQLWLNHRASGQGGVQDGIILTKLWQCASKSLAQPTQLAPTHHHCQRTRSMMLCLGMSSCLFQPTQHTPADGHCHRMCPSAQLPQRSALPHLSSFLFCSDSIHHKPIHAAGWPLQPLRPLQLVSCRSRILQDILCSIHWPQRPGAPDLPVIFAFASSKWPIPMHLSSICWHLMPMLVTVYSCKRKANATCKRIVASS